MGAESLLDSIVNQPDKGIGKVMALIIQVLILVSLIGFSIETLPNLDVRVRYLLEWLEIIIVTIFTVEYFLRIWVSPNKLKFIFSFYGLIDLVAVVPFYLTTSIDLRALRILRLLLLLRIFKLMRYNKSIVRFLSSIRRVKEELLIFLGVTLMLLYITAVGIYYFERYAQPEVFKSIFHALWWAVITLTTVGYGDVYPVTVGGKIFTGVMLLIALGIVAIPTGIIASSMTVVREKQEPKDK